VTVRRSPLSPLAIVVGDLVGWVDSIEVSRRNLVVVGGTSSFLSVEVGEDVVGRGVQTDVVDEVVTFGRTSFSPLIIVVGGLGGGRVDSIEVVVCETLGRDDHSDVCGELVVVGIGSPLVPLAIVVGDLVADWVDSIEEFRTTLMVVGREFSFLSVELLDCRACLFEDVIVVRETSFLPTVVVDVGVGTVDILEVVGVEVLVVVWI